MQLTVDHLTSTIGDIYECAVDPGRWVPCLTRLNALLNGAYTGFALSNPDAQLPRMAAFSPWDQEMLRRLSFEFSPTEVPALAAIMANDVDVGATQLEVVDEAEFKQTAFYRDWIAPQGLRDGYAVPFVRTQDRFGLLTFTTTTVRDVISPEESQFMNRLSPHVRRAVMISDLLNQQALNALMFRQAIDLLKTPVVLTAADSRIHYANEAAEALLSMGRPIAVDRDGRLLPANPAVAAGLADAIARTAGDAAADLGSRGIGLPVSDSSGVGAVAYVLPIGRGALAQGLERATAAIFIATPQATLPADEQVLATLYDLTGAECRVLLSIARGANVVETARMLNLSENTIKTQLARVFAKTGTHRQADLARLLAGLASPRR